MGTTIRPRSKAPTTEALFRAYIHFYEAQVPDDVAFKPTLLR